MGQAKRRARDTKAWLDQLTAKERIIAAASERLLEKFIEPTGAIGMCYRATFFLHSYLAAQGLETIAVTGYVNDGSDDIMMPHAWLEYNGKTTDLTLVNTKNVELNPPGRAIILDHVVRLGRVYTYHSKKSPAAAALEQEWLQSITSAPMVVRKQIEHFAMTAKATSNLEMRTFLDSAPDGITYDILKRIIES